MPFQLPDLILLYPLKGFAFFISHPQFYPLLKARLLPVTLLSTFVTVLLFVFTYLPQVALLFVFHGPGAWLNATVLVLGESAVVVALLFEAFFVDETQLDVFDAVLVSQGLEDLVQQGRIVDTNAENSVKALGKPIGSAIYAPFSLRQIIEFVIFLPLNLIPYAGVPLFLIITGYRAGPFHHWRYFKLLGLTKKERKEYIKQRQLKYTWFGIMSLVLQLIPVASMLFLITTAAGSGLWAAKMEKARRKRQAAPAQSEPEPYRDDPV